MWDLIRKFTRHYKNSFMPFSVYCPPKGAKCNFLPLKWPPFLKVKVIWGHIPRQGALYPNQCPCKFRSNNQSRLGEECKNVISSKQNGHNFIESWAIRPAFCTALRDHPRYVSAKYDWDLCNIEDAKSWKKITVHILNPAMVAAAV